MRRSKTEVIMAILSVAREATGKTRLMYKVNMNLASFNKYMRELTEAGLIAKVNGSHNIVTYRTTERGKDLLQLLRRAEEFVSL